MVKPLTLRTLNVLENMEQIETKLSNVNNQLLKSIVEAARVKANVEESVRGMLEKIGSFGAELKDTSENVASLKQVLDNYNKARIMFEKLIPWIESQYQEATATRDEIAELKQSVNMLAGFVKVSGDVNKERLELERAFYKQLNQQIELENAEATKRIRFKNR